VSLGTVGRCSQGEALLGVVTSHPDGYGDATVTYIGKMEYPHIYTLSISTDQNQSTKVHSAYTFQHKEHNLQTYHRA